MQSVFETKLIGVNDPAWQSAIAMALTGECLWGEAVAAQVEALTNLVRKQGMRMDFLVGAYRGDRFHTAVLAIEAPGGTAILYTSPAADTSEDRHAAIAALTEVRKLAASRGLVLLQSLVSAGDRKRLELLNAAGFKFLAELVYMSRPARLPNDRCSQDDRLQYISYTPERESLFCDALSESYVNSLDCPGLTGIREMSDVLKGHAATGVFEPANWLVAQLDGQPVGVLLMARAIQGAAMEVVYIGSSHRFRQKGIGTALMARAVQQARSLAVERITLAVDSTNQPARRLYKRWGFVDTYRRQAWIAVVK